MIVENKNCIIQSWYCFVLKCYHAKNTFDKKVVKRKFIQDK